LHLTSCASTTEEHGNDKHIINDGVQRQLSDWMSSAPAWGPFFAHKQNLIWKMLENEKQMWSESAVSDEYIALRDTACVQAFLSGDPSFISLAAFDALANEAVKQAFGEPVHIFELHLKSRDNFYSRQRKTLGRVLVQRGITIHGRKYSSQFW